MKNNNESDMSVTVETEAKKTETLGFFLVMHFTLRSWKFIVTLMLSK